MPDVIQNGSMHAAAIAPPDPSADPRAKLLSLLEWAASPSCDIQLPAMIGGQLPIWAPLIRDKLKGADPAEVARACQVVGALASRVGDPSFTLEDFQQWLPRTPS